MQLKKQSFSSRHFPSTTVISRASYTFCKKICKKKKKKIQNKYTVKSICNEIKQVLIA
jgi:hypothetical protein